MVPSSASRVLPSWVCSSCVVNLLCLTVFQTLVFLGILKTSLPDQTPITPSSISVPDHGPFFRIRTMCRTVQVYLFLARSCDRYGGEKWRLPTACLPGAAGLPPRLPSHFRSTRWAFLLPPCRPLCSLSLLPGCLGPALSPCVLLLCQCFSLYLANTFSTLRNTMCNSILQVDVWIKEKQFKILNSIFLNHSVTSNSGTEITYTYYYVSG